MVQIVRIARPEPESQVDPSPTESPSEERLLLLTAPPDPGR